MYIYIYVYTHDIMNKYIMLCPAGLQGLCSPTGHDMLYYNIIYYTIMCVYIYIYILYVCIYIYIYHMI